MDAWSSRWNDDDAPSAPSSSKPIGAEVGDASTLKASNPLPVSSLNAFDASDPWSADVAPTEAEPATLPEIDSSASTISTPTAHVAASTSAFPTHPLPSPAWERDSIGQVPEAHFEQTTPPSQATLQLPTQPHRTLTRQKSLSSEDPWATDASATWEAAEPSISASAFPASEPDALASGWGTGESTFEPTEELEKQYSSIQLDSDKASSLHHDSLTKDADGNEPQGEPASNLDVWAAEASSREEKARRLDREEIDKLKVDARRLITSINTEAETQASFADPSKSGNGWTDLFGSQGTARDKLSHLQTPPSALMSADGALRSDVMQASPATLNQVRSSIVRTENRGVKLASLDNSASWQRGGRLVTKTDWLPDALSADGEIGALGKVTSATMTSSPSSSSGPGWMQMSNSDTRSASGPSFLASFFKGRQASAGGTVGTTEAARSRTSSERSSTPPSRRDEPAVPAARQFETYRDNSEARYSDDPTGPDLMALDTQPAAPASTANSAPAASAAPAKGAGLLSRWRNSGIFKTSAKANPWASSGLRTDDLDWLEEHDSTDSRTGPYRYDEEGDDSFASFSDTVTASVPAKPKAPASTQAADPFDSLFGPAIPTTNSSVTATSSLRSSLSASRMSGEGGMMTINTNLGRANSIARNSAASPLQLPPFAANKRMSIAPPPRANNASPRIVSPVSQTQPRPDPFADFLSDAPPPKPAASANAIKTPPAMTAKGSSGNNLTADDLLFFDSL